MRTNKISIIILGCMCIFLIASLVLIPAKQSKAETLVENSMFYRIYVAFSVDQKAAQAWLPADWKIVSLSKGPFKGANLLVIFDDKLIIQDAEGKPDKEGSYCLAILVSPGINTKTKKFDFFVTRIYWPYNDPSPYKNGVNATVHREATIKDLASKSGMSSEVWKVQNKDGGILEFQMEYKRSVPKRARREFTVHSSVEPDFYRIYRDDWANELVKSIPAGIDRVQNYKFSSTISELRKMFDGSEKLIGITVNPCRVRQVFLP